MDTASVEQLVTIMRIPALTGQVLMLAVGLAGIAAAVMVGICLLYTSPSPRD